MKLKKCKKILRLIARHIVARHECTYVRHGKEIAPIYMYYVAPETPMMSSVIADCPDLAPPNILGKSTPTARVITTPLRYTVKFKILYRVIQRLIQHCLLRKMVYLNILCYC